MYFPEQGARHFPIRRRILSTWKIEKCPEISNQKNYPGHPKSNREDPIQAGTPFDTLANGRWRFGRE